MNCKQLPAARRFADGRIEALVKLVRRWKRRQRQAEQCAADPEIRADAERLAAEVDRRTEEILDRPPPRGGVS